MPAFLPPWFPSDTIQGILDLKSIIESNQFKPQLPSPWEEHFSDNHQIPYYYNPVTGESSWEFPIIQAPPMSIKELQSHTKSKERSQHDEISFSSLEIDDISTTVSHTTNQTSTSTSTRRVEDDLLRKGQSYQQRREELKKEYEERVLSEHTGKPQLSKYTEKIFANKSASGFHSLPIGERTKILLERKRAKEEAAKRELEQKLDQEVSHIFVLCVIPSKMRSVPQITKKSQQLGVSNDVDRVEAMLHWEESRRER